MISPKKYKSITKIHYKYRPKVCQKIRHSKIHYNIDKKKQKRREGGGGEGGIKRILHSLSADFRTYQFFCKNVHPSNLCQSPKLHRLPSEKRFLSAELCQQNCANYNLY